MENDPQLISGVLLGSVTEAVDPITQRFGDFSLFPSSQFTGNLSSGTAQDFFQPTVLGPQDFYRHSWNWLGRIEGGCAQLLANFFVFGGLDAVVAAQWRPDGLAICAAPKNQEAPFILADGAGGAFVAWRDLRDSLTTSYDLYMQHIDAAGFSQWGPCGVTICDEPGLQSSPNLVLDGQGV